MALRIKARLPQTPQSVCLFVNTVTNSCADDSGWCHKPERRDLHATPQFRLPNRACLVFRTSGVELDAGR